MEKKIASIIFIAILGAAVLVACGSGSEDTVKAVSIEDIAGTWNSGGRYHYFDADGWHQWGNSMGDLEAKLDEEPEGEFWFEGDRHYHNSKVCTETNPGIFEIEMISDTEIKFIVAEDDCRRRIGWLTGDESDPLVWTRVE